MISLYQVCLKKHTEADLREGWGLGSGSVGQEVGRGGGWGRGGVVWVGCSQVLLQLGRHNQFCPSHAPLIAEGLSSNSSVFKRIQADPNETNLGQVS